jgi:deoxycytidylate deaminase
MFELAAEFAKLKNDRRDYRLGAVGLRNDGTIVASYNGACIKNMDDRRHYMREAHAEYRLAKKMDRKSIVYVARISRTGEFKNAKPCKTCENSLRSHGIKRVYYTISKNEFGVMEL